jgi:hypothetical protein
LEGLFAPFARYVPGCSLSGNIGFGENQLQRQACGVEGPETSMTGDITTRRINNRTAWTADEDERLRQLVISNASLSDIAERSRSNRESATHAMRIAQRRSRFIMKSKAK